MLHVVGCGVAVEWESTWRCGLPVAVLGLEQCGVWREKKGVMVVWRCSDRIYYMA